MSQNLTSYNFVSTKANNLEFTRTLSIDSALRDKFCLKISRLENVFDRKFQNRKKKDCFLRETCRTCRFEMRIKKTQSERVPH